MTRSPFLSHAAEPLLLLVPEKADEERVQVARAWEAHQGEVMLLGRFWDPPPLLRERVRLYGNDTFCLVLAQKLFLSLVSPAEDLLTRLEPGWLKRRVWLAELGHLDPQAFPVFVKSAVPKLFRSSVYQTLEDLQQECQGLAPTTQVICSDPVHFEAEGRTFVLKGQVVTAAMYEGAAGLQTLQAFAAAFVQAHQLPITCVIDFGWISGMGWAVLEFNPTWGAGLNGCDAEQVSWCLAHATRPLP